MTRGEPRSLVTQLASAVGAPVELALTDGSEVISPRRDAPE
jgi:hypothetical protein